MTGKFLIEDDYYISRDQYSFIVCKKTGQVLNDTPVFESLTFHSTPEKALQSYLEIRQGEKLRKAPDGTIKEMIDILSAESERLQNTLKSAFSSVRDLQLENKL